MRRMVWAPLAERAELMLEDGEHLRMEGGTAGHFEIDDPRLLPGVRYRVSLDGGPDLPDPRSPFQPEGIDGHSALVVLASLLVIDSGLLAVAGELFAITDRLFEFGEALLLGELLRARGLRSLSGHMRLLPVEWSPTSSIGSAASAGRSGIPGRS